MKRCPFCMGEVPDAAVKCQHCGEWLDGRSRSGESELGRAVAWLVGFKIAAGVLGLIAVLLFFFLFWLPHWNQLHRDFDSPPSFPTPGRP